MTAPLIVLSTGAARLRAAAARDRVRAAVVEAVRERTGEEAAIVEADDASDARREIDAALGRGTRLVVVAGGDGSVRTAALALAGSGATLAIVPAGTGNLLASALRLPTDPVRAARAIVGARTRAIDLGRITTSVGTTGFVVAAGTGVDARIMAATTGAAKARFGVLAYFATALGMARSAQGRETRIEADGTVVTVRALATLVANAGELVPGLLGPRQPIRPDDGLLDVLAVTGETAQEGILAGLRLLLEPASTAGRSRGDGRCALRLQARSVTVTTEPPEPIEIDGDHIEGAVGRLEAVVEPGALAVLVPGSA